MFASIKAFILSLYNSHRVLLKQLASSFIKAFLVVFIPAVVGLLNDLQKLGTGGSIHLTVLLSALLAAFIAALYAGVHAAVSSTNTKLKKKMTAA